MYPYLLSFLSAIRSRGTIGSNVPLLQEPSDQVQGLLSEKQA